MNSQPTAFRQLEFSLLIGSVALMNHSCCPNVIVTYKGTLAEVRAVQEIHPGDEVRVQQWTRAVVTGRAARSKWYPVVTPAFPGYGIRFETWLDISYRIHEYLPFPLARLKTRNAFELNSLFFSNSLFYFVCLNASPACLYMHACWIPSIWVPGGCWESNLCT